MNQQVVNVEGNGKPLCDQIVKLNIVLVLHFLIIRVVDQLILLAYCEKKHFNCVALFVFEGTRQYFSQELFSLYSIIDRILRKSIKQKLIFSQLIPINNNRTSRTKSDKLFQVMIECLITNYHIKKVIFVQVLFNIWFFVVSQYWQVR